AAMQRMIDDTYLQFKSRVAEGRGMTLDEVEEVAQGHVWSGKDALEVGLVDELGDIYTAIDLAKQEADIPASANAQLVHFSGRDEYSGGERVTESVRMALMPPLPQPMMRLSPYLNLADEHVLVMLPWEIQVQ
ncbi:MAG: S49 family peptidase, partial [Alphaproteobacteria bacterium]|nr:S49 family peptidase [Alphaproteobacteria bacterium]